ncbi:TPA: tRNA (adenosine(37)-N6)-dimethylallyltransferase MiaA [Candidatus Nomurabacteria bacterium]|nr:MAG: tRNA delta(2)-isopentenylpyrophosphate transferase [Parcubacteria bacterium RAAC4_OD1_1]HCY26700.1 tRNA (adenosine(37)-N6)-dimethylallyltransferase MiaA [Candidatus Nomurabacteria bacterium]
MDKNKIIVILGQTATGKSDFAVEIAKIIKGEIISADSRQVYKGMNIGSGKITKKEMGKIPHFLLDVVHPKKVFSVSNFQKIALKEIKNIKKRNKIPIICGGTGFYIDSIVNGNIFPEVPPNKKLRKELVTKTKEELFNILKKLDKNRAENIDRNNPVRLIRAIEIAKSLGRIPSPKQGLGPNLGPKFGTLKIGLTLPPQILKEKIKTRLLSRIKKGMIKEIKDLHDKEKISWKRLESFGLEYRYVSYFLQSKMTKNEMIEKLNIEIWHYAKRQNTWFKRDKEIIWINGTHIHEKALAITKIKEFLK